MVDWYFCFVRLFGFLIYCFLFWFFFFFFQAEDGIRDVAVTGVQTCAPPIYLEFFFRELFTVVEIEAGPLLSAVFEGTNASRHPAGEHVHYRRLPFDFGLIHYASDTPYTQARTLGSRSLSFEGIDSTYAATVAVVRRILALEGERLS